MLKPKVDRFETDLAFFRQSLTRNLQARDYRKVKKGIQSIQYSIRDLRGKTTDWCKSSDCNDLVDKLAYKLKELQSALPFGEIRILPEKSIYKQLDRLLIVMPNDQQAEKIVAQYFDDNPTSKKRAFDYFNLNAVPTSMIANFSIGVLGFFIGIAMMWLILKYILFAH